MATKQFSTGEVLTASDTNTFLANSGLVYVTTATFTGTGSTVAIDGCFTSTYTNYRVLIDNMTSTGSVVNLKLRASGSANSANYYQGGWVVNYAGTTSTECRNNSNDGFYVFYANGSTYPTGAQLDIKSPQKAERTVIGGDTLFWDSAQSIGGYHSNTGSFDGFQLSSTANLTGTITVYGYRKA
jgi:hypothetical protein